MQDYILNEKIGSGSYGDVYKATDVKKSIQVAVKKFKKNYSKIEDCHKEKEL
jgi:serine/threonine protein kinase